jgi:hypothetical protein
MKEIVQRVDSSLLEERAEMHVASDVEVAAVLLLNRPDMRITALLAKWTAVVARAVAPHPWRII